ncbi:MAG: hypothetical protein IKH24_05190 [Bacteroidales bacterium]|nr:hypothetical protein [Bacteroidales bacterium]
MMRLVFVLPLCITLALFKNGWANPPSAKERLVEIDRVLQISPPAALDSLSEWKYRQISRENEAYYDLLLTIAQHKNNIPFSNDSLIAVASRYFGHSHDSRNKARAYFYHGVVRYLLAPDDTMAHRMMQQASIIVEQDKVDDDRLSALLYAYLGKINDHTHNVPEAIDYYQKAALAEKHNGNVRNEILDLCALVNCLTMTNDSLHLRKAFGQLDSTLSLHPDIHLNNVYNTKAIYYLNGLSEPDSAVLYALAWNPGSGDLGAKHEILAAAYKLKGDLDSALFHQKAALALKRPEDSLYYYILFQDLAELYDLRGEADSTAHYAQQAFRSLNASYDQKTTKRILELEKQYNLAKTQSELDRVRHSRNITCLAAGLLILLAASIFLFLRTRHKEAEKLIRVQQQQLEEEKLVRALLLSTAKTFNNVIPSLKKLVNLSITQKSPLEKPLTEMLENLRRDIPGNITEALEKTPTLQDETFRQAISALNTAQEKAIFLLTEMNYTVQEISQILGITPDVVRSTKSYIRKKIKQSTKQKTLSLLIFQ